MNTLAWPRKGSDVSSSPLTVHPIMPAMTLPSSEPPDEKLRAVGEA